MTSESDKKRPEVRPLIRKLALCGAIGCFVLAAVVALAAFKEVGLSPIIYFMLVGFGLLTASGYWPPRSRH